MPRDRHGNAARYAAPYGLLGRIAVLREIAAALARASHHEKAEAMFEQALQLAFGWKDAAVERDNLDENLDAVRCEGDGR